MKADVIKLCDTTFGKYLRDLRVSKGITLRNFCLKNSLDAGNHSKLERGILDPPTTWELLYFYVKALRLNKQERINLIYLCRGHHESALRKEFPYEFD